MFTILFGLLILGCKNSTQSTVSTEPSQTAVRGVWMTNVASDVLTSRQNIIEAVKLLDSLGFNTIFMVTWNRGYTMYRSPEAAKITGKEIDPVYGDRDPLQEVIEEAHARNIKVFAWFEFGFASSYDDQDGGILIQQKPEWASRDKNGNITEKNKFQWLNSFHPEVQDFLISLVLEVIQNYDIDGIQGDDRLPALPVNGGYDPYTTALYQSEHGDAKPPANEKDFHWVKWRSQKLNEFQQKLYQEVKMLDANCIVSVSPSIYPWSQENYLQDWPTWIRQGYADMVCPQLYRYDIEAYKKLLKEITTWQLASDDLQKFYPGVLLQVDDYNPSPEMLRDMITQNRAYGVPGEVFFFYEGIKKFKPLFKEMYSDRLPFPANTTKK
ncbi:MAG: family 10 glycosylhydrolase [Cyclobacteriaceae bacterium]|nr:family 10 glycosylhydrolase [Cyclobacteriaceae bacterium HetDA_MAG_MS6]